MILWTWRDDYGDFINFAYKSKILLLAYLTEAYHWIKPNFLSLHFWESGWSAEISWLSLHTSGWVELTHTEWRWVSKHGGSGTHQTYMLDSEWLQYPYQIFGWICFYWPLEAHALPRIKELLAVAVPHLCLWAMALLSTCSAASDILLPKFNIFEVKRTRALTIMGSIPKKAEEFPQLAQSPNENGLSIQSTRRAVIGLGLLAISMNYSESSLADGGNGWWIDGPLPIPPVYNSKHSLSSFSH